MFYGACGESLGKHGKSKDHRPDLRQVIVGVVLDDEGRPICSEIWPGNATDVKALLPVVRRLRERFGITRMCLCADRGMISAETMAELEAHGIEYILGARERNDREVMNCVGCGWAAMTERPDLIAQGYRRFGCRTCGTQFNERSDDVLNRASLPSDIIAFVVLCRLRYRLTLRDLSEIMLLRGFTVSHECIRRWEAKLLPVMGDALRKRRHGSGRRSGQSWYTRRDLPQGPRQMVSLVSRDRSRREPHRYDAERDLRCEGGSEVLPLGTISCRFRAGPGDNPRAQFLPARDSLNSGPQCPPADECVSEQSTGTGPSRYQWTDPMHARLQRA
jgi:Transposase DDE domain